MKAAVLHDFNRPLTIEDVPDPEPGRGEVIINVVAAGVCHTDVHLADNHWPQIQRLIKRPVILGHESVGHVVALGSGVKYAREGDRVGVPWVHWTCGACEYCATFHCLKPGGTLVVAGIPADDVTFSPIFMVAGEIKIVSSAGWTRQDLSEILDLAAAGKVQCRIHPMR